MFVLLLTYQVPLAQVEEKLAAHRAFLSAAYADGFLLASGPRTPRTGGVILCLLNSRAEVEAWMAKDPFYEHAIARYEVIEFTPLLHHSLLNGLLAV